MANTLTIVARDPKGDPNSLKNGNQDSDIQAVLDKIKPNASHHLVRAASVQEARTALIAFGSAPDLMIQLIGHGLPGVLQLGKGPVWTDPVANPYISYDLTSDTSSYGTLKELVISPTTRVCVLGCSVGDVRAMTSADGATLLFDLAHMWNCRVEAPVDPIYDGDFDHNGIFLAAQQNRLSRAENNEFVIGTASPPLPTPPHPAPTVVFTRLVAAPALGTLQRVSLDLTHGLAQAKARDLARSVGRPIAQIPILAAPEIVFEALVDGARCRVDVIANSRFVRASPLRTPPLTRVYIIDEEKRREFQRTVRGLLTLAGAPDF